MERENELSGAVVDSCIKIHQALGPGLMESVYEEILVYELQKRGIQAKRQVEIPVRYESILFENGFRADIIVENKLVLELKSVEKIQPVHKKQLLTYL
jgi:GxxExxY protein